MDVKKIWDSVLVEIELAVSKANFNTWFKDTYIVKIEDGIVYLGVPNAFVRDWLLNKYHGSILKILRSISDSVRSLEYMISSSKDNIKRKEESQRVSMFQNLNELPLNEYYINKEDNLNPKYTFETFVVGPFNELAHAAAQAVIKKPGIVYNPFFIYGSTGVGKTHLIQAVGNYIKTTFPGKKVFYVTSEKFALDYINSVQSNKINQFKEKYRKYDVLLMDDIQFLTNKEKSQEELFHLFNTLYDNNKQIIFSSDVHPNFIPNLEDRLKSRFAAGMIVDIPQPDHESRAAIIRAKLKQLGHVMADEVIDYIAASISGSIREMEGTINTLMCHAQLKNKDLSILDIKNHLKNNVRPKKILSPKEVIKIIAGFYNIEEDAIYQKTRRKEIVKPRQMVMFILREDFNISYPSIGEKLGGRDHTTVIHSCEKVKNDLKSDAILAQEINQIRGLMV